MRCGFGRSEITPQPGITLAGFAARCNAPCEQARDPLQVSALYLEAQAERVLIVVYDLLGLGPELLAELNAAVDRRWSALIPAARRLYCATHTHSAPATVTLLGCGLADPAYWELVVARTLDAVAQALERAVAARWCYDLAACPGLNYNRRKVLADGRVVMTRFPGQAVVKEGPVWNDFLFLKAETPAGCPIVGLVNWAAHACTVASREATADFPGELARRLERRHGFPFVYLQGACGNLNPPFHAMTYEEMLGNAEAIEQALPAPRWKPAGPGLRFQAATLRLAYQAEDYSPAELEALRAGLRQIAATGSGPPEQVAMLANILNVPPDGAPDPVLLRHIALALEEWSAGLLKRPRAAAPAGYPLAVAVLALGRLALVFIAAEVFAETAFKLRALLPSRTVGVVGYASPLAGYLPPDDALEEGGYEVEHAYRFYGHPSAYARGSEERLLAAVARLAAPAPEAAAGA